MLYRTGQRWWRREGMRRSLQEVKIIIKKILILHYQDLLFFLYPLKFLLTAHCTCAFFLPAPPTSRLSGKASQLRYVWAVKFYTGNRCRRFRNFRLSPVYPVRLPQNPVIFQRLKISKIVNCIKNRIPDTSFLSGSQKIPPPYCAVKQNSEGKLYKNP